MRGCQNDRYIPAVGAGFSLALLRIGNAELRLTFRALELDQWDGPPDSRVKRFSSRATCRDLNVKYTPVCKRDKLPGGYPAMFSRKEPP